MLSLIFFFLCSVEACVSTREDVGRSLVRQRNFEGVSSRDTVVVTEGTQALSLWEDECDGDDDEGDWSTVIGP